MATSKFEVALLDLGGQVVGADHVGAGVAGLLGGLALGEHRHPHVLAGAGGQGDGAAHDLVGLAGIDAEAHRQLDGLVELAPSQALHQAQRLGGREQLVRDRTASAASVYFLPSP